MASAVYISSTRIMDHKHHPADVIAGVIVGAISQTLNCIFVLKLFHSPSRCDFIPKKSLKIDSAVLNTSLLEEAVHSVTPLEKQIILT